MCGRRETQQILQVAELSVIIHNMTIANPITDVLRQAIIDSGLPLLKIEQDTGVQRASLSRFVRGMNSLRLDVADKLAAYFGLTLTPNAKKQPTKNAKG